MSSLRLKEFHTFLDGLIEQQVSQGERFSIDRTIGAIVSSHRDQMEKIEDHIVDLGLRALIRNNSRAKTGTEERGPDMFGQYPVSKRVPVPYRDDQGKLRWDRKRRDELSFADLDDIMSRWSDRPAAPSRERKAFEDIVKMTAPYRDRARTVSEALKLAQRDGHKAD